MMRNFRRRCDERGATMMLVALLLPVLILMTAFALDLGRQRNGRRDAQAAADVIALDMARLADGRTIGQINAGNATQLADSVALAQSAARNGYDVNELELDWGVFVDGVGFQTLNGLGTGIPDAARIVATGSVDYFFQPGDGSFTREAIGRYGADPLAGFRVGSFGVSVEQAGFLNQLLSPILGNPVGLDVLGYQGLATANIGLAELGVELGLLTPDQVLSAVVPLDDVILASAEVLRRNGNAVQADLLANLITAEIRAMTIRLGDIVSVDSSGQTAGLGAAVNVIDILQTGAFLSQCTPAPTGFDDCSGLSIPTLATSLPGVTTAGSVKVIQSPRYHFGKVGTGVDTGQVEVNLVTTVGSQFVGNCVPSLANLLCLVNGLLVGAIDASVNVNARITLAGGRNTISAIDCANPAAKQLGITSNTDLYNIQLTVTVNFGRRGLLGGVLGPLLGSLTLTGSTSTANAASGVTFTVAPDVLGVTQKSTGSGNIGLAGLTLNTSGTGVLGTLGNLGINRTVATVTTALVNPVIALLDAQLLGPLTDLLGLNIVGSDLRAERIECEYGSVQLVG